MSAPGGGPDIGELLRGLGRDAVLREAEAAGLKPTRGANPRMRCPFPGCRDKSAAERSSSAWVYSGNRGEPRIHCARCSGNGSLVDLLAAVNGWTAAQAIAHLRGLPAPASKPALHLVAPEASPASDKLAPEQVRAIWDALAKDDAAGRAYLEGRGLGDAADTGLVRFATAEHPNARVKAWARSKRLVVGLLKDVVGQPRGLQGRLARPLRDGERGKCISLKDTWNKRAFFGSPELIEGAPVVAVAEGLADWLALAGWAGREVVCVGAAGMESLASLAEELARTGISVEGKLFLLFPQNDRPLNKSRAAFDRLGQLLHKAGARVVMQSTPEDTKDVADWLQAHPDAAWPPAAAATALGGEVEHETPATQLVEPPKGGLPVPARVVVEAFGQDFGTLCHLLDDPLHREAILGRAGELELNEMDETVWYAGQEIKEGDLSRIRLGLELHAKATDGKKLKFAVRDIGEALALLARRRAVHPLRDSLTALKWDGQRRLDELLPRALGHAPSSLEAVLLERWVLAAAARALKPGCKMESVLVLVGEEGRGKSTFFSAIAGDQWFTDEAINAESGKDGKLILRKKWVIEWAELEAMTRARSVESVMQFVSQRVDLFRAPYGRGLTEAPRHCLFGASTNRRAFLTWRRNRRFWPVRVDQLDIAWVAAQRDQLLAEAVARVQAGEQWWLEQEYEDLLAAHNQGHQHDDSWLEVVRDWVGTRATTPEYLTVRLALTEVIKKDAQHITRADDMRMADVLRALGWVGPARRFGGAVGRFWLPPGSQLELGDR